MSTNQSYPSQVNAASQLVHQSSSGCQKKTTLPKKQVYFYVPVRLDFTRYPDEWHDSIGYLLDLIRWKRVCWKADNNGFVYLKYEYITKVIDKKIWNVLCKKLEEDGVIECDGGWKPGVKSLGYRILPEYWETRRVDCRDALLSARVLRREQERDNNFLPVHLWLRDQLQRLEFDAIEAKKIIGTLSPESGSPLSVSEYRKQIMDACQNLNNGDLYLIRDRYGRVHTPITSLPRELRACLSVGNQPLVGIDLANSQPLVAGILARQFYRHRMAKSRLINMTFADLGDPYRYREFLDMEKKVMSESASGASCNKCNSCAGTHSQSHKELTAHPTAVIGGKEGLGGGWEDLDEYMLNCMRGRLYETLMRKGDDRKLFKRKFFTKVFFGSNEQAGGIASRFKALYPSVASMIYELKRKDYRQSSWLMQCYEATIFIRLIAERIRQDQPNIPLFTIHDSFLTTPDWIEYVESMVRETFARIKINVTLHRETY